MTVNISARSGIYVLTANNVATNPAPQLSQDITLAETVDGVACSMLTDAPKGCGFYRLTVNGVNWVDTPLSHGQGIQAADNFLRTGEFVANNPNSPTEGGCQKDGSSIVTGTSVNMYRAISADGKQLKRVQYYANWGAPNQITNVVPSWNDRLVSSNKVVSHVIWGWSGDTHVIQFLRDVYIPNDRNCQLAQTWDAVSLSVYATTSLFGTIEYLNPATGATRAYPGFPDTSNTEVIMLSDATGTKCMSHFQPLGEWGATGYSQEIDTSGLSNYFTRCRETGTSIASGVRRYNAYLVFASNASAGAARTQVISSVQALYAANITRSTNITLPDVS